LTYELIGAKYQIRYTATLSNVTMEFISPEGDTRTEVYTRK
jgi:putative exporter of polyketide antibiotics